MTLDFRHLSRALDSMIAEVRRSSKPPAKHGLTYELTPTADFPPLYFDKGCVEAVRGAAKAWACRTWTSSAAPGTTRSSSPNSARPG
jgi:N-carbamoyl-L-amino-acid hydrolase